MLRPAVHRPRDHDQHPEHDQGADDATPATPERASAADIRGPEVGSLPVGGIAVSGHQRGSGFVSVPIWVRLPGC